MSLITAPFETPSPAKIAADIIRSNSFGLWRRMVETQINTFDLVWRNTYATPQEILNELGGDAAELFQHAAALVQCILTVNPTALTEAQWKPPVTVTPNPDGTVTLG